MAVCTPDQDRSFPTTWGFSLKQTRDFDVRLSGLPPVLTKRDAASDVRRGDDHLGWKGLLEISRNSGASGVLGAAFNAEDEQCLLEPKSATGAPWLEVCCTTHIDAARKRLVKSVIRGIKACQEPERAVDGMGGTYFFTNESGRKVAILKPCDEEPLAPNNPKGYVGRTLGDPGWKPTVRVGEAAMREVAAYLLDHEGFAKVPASVLVRARHPVFCYNNRMSSVRQSTFDLPGMAGGEPGELSTTLPMKLGSLQEFVAHECDTSEMGPSRFSTRDVHRIGILDVRLFNTDRHAGNMLVRKVQLPQRGDGGLRGGEYQYELIPIDHGFCLPETLEAPYFEWLHWPQTMLPFGEEELAYIRNLNIEADKELLRKELPNLRPECLRVMELATTVLKRGAAAGLTLFEIASILTRPFHDADEEASDLEKFCAAEMQALQAGELDDSSSCTSESADEFEDEAEDGDVFCANASRDCPACAAGSAADGKCRLSAAWPEPADSAASTAAAISGLCLADSARLSRKAMPIGSPFASGASAVNIGASVHHSTGMSTVPRTLARCGSSSKDEESIFGFDEQEDAPGHPAGASSVGSSNSSGGGLRFAPFTDASSGLDTRDSPLPPTPIPPARGQPFGQPFPLASPLHPAAGQHGDPARGVAHSVHAGGFLFFKHMKKVQAGPAAIRKRHRKARKTPQAYPPPVLARAPDSLELSFASLDDGSWRLLLDRVDQRLDQAIRSGRFKQLGDAAGGIAMSC